MCDDEKRNTIVWQVDTIKKGDSLILIGWFRAKRTENENINQTCQNFWIFAGWQKVPRVHFCFSFRKMECNNCNNFLFLEKFDDVMRSSNSILLKSSRIFYAQWFKKFMKMIYCYQLDFPYLSTRSLIKSYAQG